MLTIIVAVVLLFNKYCCFINEKLASSHDWIIDSTGKAFDVSFSSSIIQMEHMRLLTKSHIERFSLGTNDNQTERIYKINAPSKEYQIIFENDKMFVTSHINGNGHSSIILWDTLNGNMLNRIIIKKSIVTYACIYHNDVDSVQLFLLYDDVLLEKIDITNGITLFSYQFPYELINNNTNRSNSYRLQASIVNYQQKLFLYYFNGKNILVADISLITGESSSLPPYSVVYNHDNNVNLSECYTSIHGLVCFVQNISGTLAKTYVFTINRDNYQQQFLVDETMKITPKFHSNCILELYNQDNILKYMFYADGIIADISNQLPLNQNITIMHNINQPAQNIYLGFISLTDGNISIYELYFEENQIVFHPIYETIVEYTHNSFYNHIEQIKFTLNSNNNAYNLYVICQFLDDDQNQLLQLYYNDILQWSNESPLKEITNILPIEIMEQRKLNNDETFAYQSEYYVNRMFYRLKINYNAVVNFFLQLSDHFGINRKFSVYKNQRHSNILLVTTKTNYVYGIYSKNGKILWSHKLNNFKPFNDSKSTTLPIYLLRKSLVKNSVYYSSIATVVGHGLFDNHCGIVLWTFDPLNGISIDVDHFPNFMNKTIFTKLNNGQPGVYKLTNGFGCGKKPYHILPFSITPIKNILIFASVDYDQIAVFPSTNHSTTSMITKSSIKTVYQLNDLTVNGASIVSDEDRTLSISNKWKINIPNDSFNIRIHTADIDYYNDKTKMIFDNVRYKPFDLIDVVAVSYMCKSTAQRNSDDPIVLTVLLINTNTGNIIKSFEKHNVLGSAPATVNLVRNLCTVISTNYRTKSSSISVIGFYYNSNTTKNAQKNYQSIDNLLVLNETYLLGTYQVTHAIATKTYFGFSQKSLILALYDGRLWAIPYKLLDPRRYLKKRIVDESNIIDYYPQIEAVPTNFINKEYILSNISNIITFPSHLESTSIVCAASNNGLYCSHLVGLNGAPFDVLSVNFDRYFVVVSIIALIVVLVLSIRFNNKTQFYNQWL